MFISPPFGRPLRAKAYREAVRQKYGELAGEFERLFPLETDSQAKEAQLAVGRDHWFAWQMRTWAKLHVRKQPKTFSYYFNNLWPIGVISRKWGVFHGAEVPFAYGNLDRVGLPFTEADRALSDTMMKYWRSFAATGDPNGAGTPAWAPYDDDSRKVMEFKAPAGMADMPHRETLDFFDRYEDALREKMAQQ